MSFEPAAFEPVSFEPVLQVDCARPRCSETCRRILCSAEVAASAEQPIVARQLYLQAIRQDSTGTARKAYARFLTQQQEYASAVAEFSRLLESFEDQPANLAFQRDVLWDLVRAYEGWGQARQGLYFLEQAIRMEARVKLHASDAPFPHATASKLPLQNIRSATEQLGMNLLQFLATGDAAREEQSWLQLGMLSYLEQQWNQALSEFTEALKLARGAQNDDAASLCFLWLGRVFAQLKRPQLATLSFRRAANWGNGPKPSERACEFRLRCELPSQS